ncbi:TATA box-binding protein-associated factor RNA polymerase I subunit B isoform 2-T2 [Anomaloglossus baeobatrachus]|uniref:TATA box-binding protein-associated factor RNA polymerase I subunit B isoform X2 n=1 Tax=Anomaloglossus baeobatrachus TaxID=238106 RepID=UPI003F4F744B
MDDEDTRSYKVPCPQCAEIDWGISDEGKFYCKNCHTIIEKTQELADTDIFLGNTKVQSISRGLRKKKNEYGWEWYICEGFQFILLKQAEALEALGIGPDLKDNVMCNMWRRYLQVTKQAYCKHPFNQTTHMKMTKESNSESQNEGSASDANNSFATSDSDMDFTSTSSFAVPSSGGLTDLSDGESVTSVQSGSVDAAVHRKKKTWERKMSMPMTLAFCYLSLLWVRASITLSDLLRLAFYRHVPYYNSQQHFPEKTNLYGADVHIFEVRNFPVYKKILDISHDLGKFLQLPPFPPVTDTCYYHPNVLCLKYLMEVNLPDELHNWTCFVAKKTGLYESEVLTYNPKLKRKRMIPYDVQAAAIIVVVLKLIFGLNDDLEWQLAKLAEKKNGGKSDITIFDFQKWYMTMRPCLDEARMNLEEEQARFSWDSERVLFYSRKSKSRVLKRQRTAKNLQSQFSKLAGAAPDAGNQGPSSFLFNWEEQNTGKICFHGHRLEGIAQEGKKLVCSLKKNYWLNTVKKCRSRFCEHWKLYDETQFPSTYRFVISLFSVVLRVEPSTIHYEVGLVEETLCKQIPKVKPKKSKKKKRV